MLPADPDRGRAQPLSPADQQVAPALASVARSRADGWRVVVELLRPPGDELVTRLRNGSLVADLRASLDWLGDDAGRFLDTTMTLDTLVRRAARRAHTEDLAALRAEYARLFPEGQVEPLRLLLDQAGLVEEEAQAWTRGESERAKKLRVEQNARLEAELVDSLPQWCVDLDARAGLMLYKLTPRLLTSYLAVESGRDFDRTVSFEGSLLTFGE